MIMVGCIDYGVIVHGALKKGKRISNNTWQKLSVRNKDSIEFLS